MNYMTTIRLSIIAAIALTASVRAEPITVITNYFPGYVLVTNGWTTAEESGLSNGIAYVAIPLSVVTNATVGGFRYAIPDTALVADGAASDIRLLLYGINDAAYTAYDATASTNRPSNATLIKVSNSTSITAFETMHALKSQWTLSGAAITTD